MVSLHSSGFAKVCLCNKLDLGHMKYLNHNSLASHRNALTELFALLSSDLILYLHLCKRSNKNSLSEQCFYSFGTNKNEDIIN